MILLALVACLRLDEGAYTIDYADVTVDSCDLYSGGQALEDTTGELVWDGDTLVFEFDGTDDDLEFAVEGTTFTRESHGFEQLDASCALTSVQSDVGEMRSTTSFSGTTELVADLEGDCSWFEQLWDTPCEVAFDWAGAHAE